MTEVQLKAEIRKRDGDKCLKCGMTNDESIAANNRQLEIHRLIPGSEYLAEWCITLCKSCHDQLPSSLEEILFGDPHQTGVEVLFFNLFNPEHQQALALVPKIRAGKPSLSLCNRTRTIRIADDLLAMIQYLKFDADQHGERFKATEFLDELLRGPITEAFNRAQKRNRK